MHYPTNSLISYRSPGTAAAPTFPTPRFCALQTTLSAGAEPCHAFPIYPNGTVSMRQLLSPKQIVTLYELIMQLAPKEVTTLTIPNTSHNTLPILHTPIDTLRIDRQTPHHPNRLPRPTPPRARRPPKPHRSPLPHRLRPPRTHPRWNPQRLRPHVPGYNPPRPTPRPPFRPPYPQRVNGRRHIPEWNLPRHSPRSHRD